MTEPQAEASSSKYENAVTAAAAVAVDATAAG